VGGPGIAQGFDPSFSCRSIRGCWLHLEQPFLWPIEVDDEPEDRSQPPDIPQRPMGSIPVVVRLVRPDGEEWWPATANRWSDTHEGRCLA
jgi:hypothetical protein